MFTATMTKEAMSNGMDFFNRYENNVREEQKYQVIDCVIKDVVDQGISYLEATIWEEEDPTRYRIVPQAFA